MKAGLIAEDGPEWHKKKGLAIGIDEGARPGLCGQTIVIP